MDISSNLGFELTDGLKKRISDSLIKRFRSLVIESFNIISLGGNDYEVYAVVTLNKQRHVLSRTYTCKTGVDFVFQRDSDRETKAYQTFFGSQLMMLIHKLV